MCVCVCVCMPYLTGVVDKPRLVPRHGGVHHIICINPEHVAPYTLQQHITNHHCTHVYTIPCSNTLPTITAHMYILYPAATHYQPSLHTCIYYTLQQHITNHHCTHVYTIPCSNTLPTITAHMYYALQQHITNHHCTHVYTMPCSNTLPTITAHMYILYPAATHYQPSLHTCTMPCSNTLPTITAHMYYTLQQHITNHHCTHVLWHSPYSNHELQVWLVIGRV